MTSRSAQDKPSVEQRILDACPWNDTDPTITFDNQFNRTVYLWWTSEREHRTLSKAERKHLLRLLSEGRLRHVHGWQHGRGYIERARS